MADRLAIDSNCLTYLVDAARPGYNPKCDNRRLADERVAMLRILLYRGDLYILPSVEAEYLKIKEDKKLVEFSGLIAAVCHELTLQNETRIKEIETQASRIHTGRMDCRIFAEAVVGEMSVLITFDHTFKNKFKDNRYGVRLISPSELWPELKIPNGNRPIISPSQSNPLHRNRFWEWK